MPHQYLHQLHGSGVDVNSNYLFRGGGCWKAGLYEWERGVKMRLGSYGVGTVAVILYCVSYTVYPTLCILYCDSTLCILYL